MQKLMINPTETSQWQELILSATNKNAIDLSEDLESYLVFLLMRFTSFPDVASKVIAIEFLEAQHLQGTNKHQALQEIGDYCLLFAGLFPGRARKRRLNISYYVDIGQTAYSNAAASVSTNLSLPQLFTELCDNFVELMDVLQTTREINNTVVSLDPLQAAELYENTNSQHAKNILTQFTNNNTIIFPPEYPNSTH